MKNSVLNKTSLPIELTSLLDVIFIVLLIVMCNQQMTAEKIKQQAAEAAAAEQQARQEAQDARATAELYRDQLDSVENISELASFVTIYADYEDSDPKIRKLRILRNDEAIEEIEINPLNKGEAMASFELALSEFIATQEDKAVYLSINTDRILYRDEMAFRDVVDRLQREHNNLYLKGGSDE